MVQLTKASLYFGNADGFGDWRVLIGTNATKKLKEFRISDTMKFKVVYKKLKELSNGQFSDDNQNRLDGNYSGVPIFEARMQQDLRLVYQIDCVADHDVEIERQVIKIYGIYTHTQLDGIWDAMSHHLSGKGEEYVRRCKYRNKPVLPGAKVSVPAVFPRGIYDVIVEPPPLALGDQEMDQLHSLLALNKYVTFSQALLNGLIAKNDVEHVFELAPQERKIIECTTSCYVLGRSGTGKTTTMLFKMLEIQRAWQLRSEDFDIPRPKQIFVTKSRMLANKVEEYFVKLLQSLSLAGCTLEELARLQSRHVDRGLVDDDDVPDAQSGIPQRYSELEDHHFPLFLTFDQLARMIAVDILDADHPEGQRITKLFMQSHDPEALDTFVSYEVFVNSYWSRFPQRLTKGQDPWLVFGEVMGIIKGSEKSLEFDDGALDKNTYCGLSSRSNPTFSGQREVVYAIYEAYSKLKRQHQHHDVADRTHAILKTLQGGTSFKGSQVDFLYVDEAQDNLLIDALLLRLLCNNPEGLFWAGDTAQTISAGSSFRFNDLKAFIHRIEIDQASHIVQERAVTPPESFQLAINYRSHGGIVNCAHSVIELISHFWPNSIDHLRPEHGIVDGPKPVFFMGWGKDTIHYQQFFGAPGTRIEFGAQQCILVRDEKAKEKFRQQVGDIGLIMTLYESKGLEFNDVLLYNFFEDSGVDLSRWRVVLAAIGGMVGGHNRSPLQVPAFERDENRYAGICSELKVLYVGITRARKRLWIIDKSDKAEPMKLFWSSRSQIQNGAPGVDVSHLAASSTAEEWAESGRSLFQHKRYTQAIHCFRRANMPREVRVATAYHLREVARATTGIALLTEQQRAFAKAAEAFITCTSETLGKEKLQYYRTAADCYVRAADDRQAADAYWDAEEYELAERYRKAGKLKKTVDVPNVESKRISRDCSDELLTVRRPYHRSKNDEGCRAPWSLSHSIEEEPEFLDIDLIQPGYDDTRNLLLVYCTLRVLQDRDASLKCNQ
ncbi:P-loop containing nucleoside triphosphate hydrolase protein [Pisolithus sp. B1]|nr:P-loop containing nucleoside triphosphate hydrolase protein [Pisolithus sp. B1]